MSARQLIVLVAAAIAAVAALFIIRGMTGRESAAPNAENAAPISGQQVLVAARDIPQGAQLSPSDLAVRLFPQESVTPNFVRLADNPSAQADFVGAIARRPFVQGEPITVGSVVNPEGRGAMAAQLQPGYRAVAVEISARTAAGGYIQPNDHVDVIVTHRVQVRDGAGANEQARSDLVLEDIRVLALGTTTQPPANANEGPTPVEAAYAVLELTAEEARTLALAEEMGDITLALRGVQVETVGMRQERRQQGLSQQGGAVRVHAFGNVSGGSQ